MVPELPVVFVEVAVDVALPVTADVPLLALLPVELPVVDELLLLEVALLLLDEVPFDEIADC